MHKATLLFSFLLFAYFGTIYATSCSKLKVYTTKLEPLCEAGDVGVKWPNYEDQRYYIHCIALGKAVLVLCPEDNVFGFSFQSCKSCDDYLAPQECSKLKTASPPKCVPIASTPITTTPAIATPKTTTPAITTVSANYSTPHYPSTEASTSTSTTTTTTSTTTTTLPSGSTDATKGTTVTDNVPETTTDVTEPEVTETTKNSGSTDFPGPPSPSTNDPNVPQPETEPQTPPNVEATPPSVG